MTSIAVPVWSLVWRAGLRYPRITVQTRAGDDTARSEQSIERRIGPYWSSEAFRQNLVRSAASAGDQLLLSLKVALATGAIVVPTAWLFISVARTGGAGQLLLGGLVCLLFALPGALIGIGIQLAAGRLSAWLANAGIGTGISDGWGGHADLPPAELVWLHGLRALPFAIGLIWPVRRIVSRRLLEAAAVDGADLFDRFRYIELPAVWSALLAAGLAAGVISLGELSGSVIVTPPGQQPLSVRIFTLAHYGMESHLAGICLLLLAISAAAGSAVIWCMARNARTLRE
jgi:ABC-type Fe3+ transport system permease subunit